MITSALASRPGQTLRRKWAAWLTQRLGIIECLPQEDRSSYRQGSGCCGHSRRIMADGSGMFVIDIGTCGTALALLDLTMPALVVSAPLYSPRAHHT